MICGIQREEFMADDSTNQLSFKLPTSENRNTVVNDITHQNVVSFVSASTRAFRSEAAERVSRAGIFSTYKKQN